VQKPMDADQTLLLHELSRSGKQACLKALLGSRFFDNAQIMRQTFAGESALHMAIRASQRLSLEKLLAHIAGAKEVPLAHASKSHWLAAAVLDTVGSQGEAASQEEEEGAPRHEAGAQHEGRHEKFGDNCLHLAAAVSEGAMLDRLFQALEDGDASRESGRTNARGWTCMHVACYNLQIDCIRVIVQRVGTKNPLVHRLTADGLKQTSVHLAVQARPTAERSLADKAILPVVGELVKLGADVTALDSEFQTPEAMAKKASLTKVAEVLGSVESPSSKLTRAILDKDDAAVRAQLEDMKTNGSLGATINGKGRDGLSALHQACITGWMPGVDLLLQFEADISDEDVEKRAAPLWHATRSGHANVAGFLCRYLPHHLPPAQCRGSRAAECRMLLLPLPFPFLFLHAGLILHVSTSKGAPTAARAKDGSSALHGACRNGMTALVETLLGDRKVDTAWCDSDGLSALDVACLEGNLSTVKAFLISRPGCAAESNARGESPLFAAVRCSVPAKAEELVKLLVEEVWPRVVMRARPIFARAARALARACMCGLCPVGSLCLACVERGPLSTSLL